MRLRKVIKALKDKNKELMDAYEEIGKLEFEKKANLNYQSYHFTPGNKHEINPELISKIANS